MRVVIIMGMHRAGTSLTARIANLAGVDLGPERHLLPATIDNPIGYWEERRVVQLNDTLLGVLGGWWHEPPALAPGWEHDWQLDALRVWAAQLVAERLDDPSLAQSTGYKDPRFSLLLPFWRTVVDVTSTVISLRDPREVVDSLVRRDGLAPEHAASLWLRYTLSSIEAAPEALAVRYDDWFAQPAATLELLCRHLGFEHDNTLLDAVTKLVDPTLRRSERKGRWGPLADAALELYGQLSSGPVDAHMASVRELSSAFAEPSR